MSNTKHGVEHQYKVDDLVIIHPNSHRGIPQKTEARITALEPYLGRPGYYVSYPLATEQWHCHGGWMMETAIVGLKSSCTCAATNLSLSRPDYHELSCPNRA